VLCASSVVPNVPAPTAVYTLSLHDALPISTFQLALVYMTLFATSVFILLGFIYWATAGYMARQTDETIEAEIQGLAEQYQRQGLDRKSTRLNSSHVKISYAVFCLKKKTEVQ